MPASSLGGRMSVETLADSTVAWPHRAFDDDVAAHPLVPETSGFGRPSSKDLIMTTIPKHLIIAKLRDRDLNARADWVDKELPEQVDTVKHASLLRTLNIDLKEFTTEDEPA